MADGIGGKMDLWNPLPQLESAFHRRNLPFVRPVEDTKSEDGKLLNSALPLSESLAESLPLAYHNHILVGSNLWFLQKPVRPKDVGKNRLVLVQGTRHGRLCGLRLSRQSEIQGGKQSSLHGLPSTYDTHFTAFGAPKDADSSGIAGNNSTENPNEIFFSIEITGVSHRNNKIEKWQIVTQSLDVYTQWMQALHRARLQSDVVYASGEFDKLRDVCRRMRENLVVRKHVASFRIYEKSFVGIRAVKWLMAEKKCSMLQALAIGNRMLNVGLISHVNYEHLFYPRNLLYQFSDDVPVQGKEREIAQEAPSRSPIASPTREKDKEREREREKPLNPLTKVLHSTLNAALHRVPNAAPTPSPAVSAGPTAAAAQPLHDEERSEHATLHVSEVQSIVDENRRLLALHHLRQTHDHSAHGSLSQCLSHCEAALKTLSHYRLLVTQHREQRLKKAQLLQFLLLLFTLCWLCVDNAQGEKTARSFSSYCFAWLCAAFYFSSVALIGYTLYADHTQEDDFSCREDELQGECEALQKNVNELKATEQAHNEVMKKKTNNIAETIPTAIVKEKIEKSEKMEKTEKTDGGEGECVEDDLSEEDEEEEEDDASDVDIDDLVAMGMHEDDADDALFDAAIEREEDEDAAAPLDEGYLGIAERRQQQHTSFRRRRGQSEESDNISELTTDTYTIPNHSKKDFLRSPTRKILAQHNEPELWPNFPILIKRAAAALPQSLGYDKSKPLLQPIRVHRPGPPDASVIDIETDLFVGKAYLIFNHLRDTDPSQFKDKKRHSQAIIQGRFKVRVPFSKVYAGQAYDEPTHQLPIQWLVKGMGRVQPGFKSFLTGDKPYFISPIMAACQHVVISPPGQEPAVTSLQHNDDLHLLGPEFHDMPPKKRKMYFSKRRHLIKHFFEPDLVYTFDFYQNIFNFATFQLNLGFLKYDLVKILGTCPIQIMAVLWDPIENGGVPPDTWRFLYNFEVFHHHSIPADLLVTSASFPAPVMLAGGVVHEMPPKPVSPSTVTATKTTFPSLFGSHPAAVENHDNNKDKDTKIEAIYDTHGAHDLAMTSNPFHEKQVAALSHDSESEDSDEEAMRRSVSSIASEQEKNVSTSKNSKSKGKRLIFFKRNATTAPLPPSDVLSGGAESSGKDSPTTVKRKRWLGRMTSHQA